MLPLSAYGFDFGTRATFEPRDPLTDQVDGDPSRPVAKMVGTDSLK
jgi:hypothetical protein